MLVTDMYPQLSTVVNTIQATATELGYTNKEIARACGMSVKTLMRRFESPWEFTIKELIDISHLWNMTIKELIGE